ncbi:MAG: hypothetical protein AABY22_09930 [Nanoarchaeota archaeon]
MVINSKKINPIIDKETWEPEQKFRWLDEHACSFCGSFECDGFHGGEDE